MLPFVVGDDQKGNTKKFVNVGEYIESQKLLTIHYFVGQSQKIQLMYIINSNFLSNAD